MKCKVGGERRRGEGRGGGGGRGGGWGGVVGGRELERPKESERDQEQNEGEREPERSAVPECVRMFFLRVCVRVLVMGVSENIWRTTITS